MTDYRIAKILTTVLVVGLLGDVYLACKGWNEPQVATAPTTVRFQVAWAASNSHVMLENRRGEYRGISFPGETSVELGQEWKGQTTLELSFRNRKVSGRRRFQYRVGVLGAGVTFNIDLKHHGPQGELWPCVSTDGGATCLPDLPLEGEPRNELRFYSFNALYPGAKVSVKDSLGTVVWVRLPGQQLAWDRWRLSELVASAKMPEGWDWDNPVEMRIHFADGSISKYFAGAFGDDRHTESIYLHVCGDSLRPTIYLNGGGWEHKPTSYVPDIPLPPMLEPVG